MSQNQISSNAAVATVSGSTVTIVGAGTTTITASQAGNSNYNAAPNVNQTLTVSKTNQTITFGALTSKKVGDPAFNLTATASSGLTVTYTSSNTAVATVSGITVTIVGQGTTSITASQAGNANYNAASNVSQDLEVAPGGVFGVFVPDVFTPNRDGVNDRLKVLSSFQLQSITFQVFDGFNTLYSTSNVSEALNRGWNGVGGVSNRSYTYRVVYVTTSGKTGFLSGVVLLIRQLILPVSED